MSSSKDVLYLVIAFCLLWLTLFTSLLLYYLITFAKRGKEMVDLIDKKVKKLAETLDFFRKKVEPTTSSLATVIAEIKTLITSLQGLSRKRKKRKK